ncbi:MAG TPA: HD-GYP domain-containing protein [Chloroflexota bacterium]
MIRALRTPPPTLAIVAIAGLGIGCSWLVSPPGAEAESPLRLLLLLCLVTAAIIAHWFPIHIRIGTKVYMVTVVLYLLAVLITPSLAVTGAAVAILVGEISVSSRTGNFPSDIANQTARMAIGVLLASLLAHLGLGLNSVELLFLTGAAVLLWAVDMVTSPFVYAPITGEPVRQIIMTTVKGAGPPEAAQVVVGLILGIAAIRQPLILSVGVVPIALVYIACKSTKEVHAGTRQILEIMADTVDMRDPYTGGHSRRVADLTRQILRELHKSGPEVDLTIAAARVHDIGKIAIPDRILLKDKALTPQEWEIMASHPERGAELLLRYPDFARGAEMIRHHHEAWDGSGYPHALHRTEIPFGARVIAVADSFDTMTSDRPYRKGMMPEKAASILKEGRGKQWDPEVVDAFLRSREQADHAAATVPQILPQTGPVTA